MFFIYLLTYLLTYAYSPWVGKGHPQLHAIVSCPAPSSPTPSRCVPSVGCPLPGLSSRNSWVFLAFSCPGGSRQEPGAWCCWVVFSRCVLSISIFSSWSRPRLVIGWFAATVRYCWWCPASVLGGFFSNMSWWRSVFFLWLSWSFSKSLIRTVITFRKSSPILNGRIIVSRFKYFSKTYQKLISISSLKWA